MVLSAHLCLSTPKFEHSLVIPSAQTTFTFLPTPEGAKMVRAEGITSAGDITYRDSALGRVTIVLLFFKENTLPMMDIIANCRSDKHSCELLSNYIHSIISEFNSMCMFEFPPARPVQVVPTVLLQLGIPSCTFEGAIKAVLGFGWKLCSPLQRSPRDTNRSATPTRQ